MAAWPLGGYPLVVNCERSLELDLDVDAGGQVEAHQAVDRAGAGVEDVDEALVGAHLKLLAGVLVLVRRADDRVQVALGGQGDGAAHAGAGVLGGLDDLLGRLVNDLVIVALEANPDLLA